MKTAHNIATLIIKEYLNSLYGICARYDSYTPPINYTRTYMYEIAINMLLDGLY